MEPDIRRLIDLLDYELKQSTRHRRYLSLVMLSFEDGNRKFVDLLRSGLRQSDAMSLSENVVVVLMGATAKSEAIRAVSRYGDEFEGRLNVRCSVSSFPDDGKTPEELLTVLQRRLKKAAGLSRGAVVAQ